MNSFFPDAVASWNILMMSHLLIFLKNISILFYDLKPKIFSVYMILRDFRYLFQLRVSLSPLRSHKFRHNFADTLSEICRCNQGIEDTNHFLFSCPDYATPRATLAANVINILQENNLNYLGNQSKLYLYGHPSIIFTDNRKIILSTIKYIKATTIPSPY